MSRTFLSSLVAVSALTLWSSTAAAEPKDREASALGKEAMDNDYLGTQFEDAEAKLQTALKTCGKQGCSDKVRAQLHLNLAIVYIAGLKKKDRGNKEMEAAIAADSSVALSADFATPEVEKAYVAAGGVRSDAEEPATAAKEEDEEDEPKTAPAAPEDAPAKGASGARRNWLSAAFQLDLLSYQTTTGVCSGAAQYQCFLQGQPDDGPIYLGSGNQLQGGVGVATKRLLVGYERLLFDNLTAGIKLGFAFGGSPKSSKPGASAFLPFHAELRGNYWFGSAPFARDGLRPYAGLAAGLGQIDGHVSVEYYENAMGYNAGAKGKLDAWRQAGKTFVGAHAGVAYAFTQEQQLFLELRILQLLGPAALGGAVNLGYAFGM